MMDWLRDAWHGRVPLWIAYWILGVGGNMSFVALLLGLYLLGGTAVLGFLWLVYALSLIWFVFIFGAIWRAAGSYPGRRLWPLLARIGVCIGIPRMSAEAFLLLYLTRL